MRKLYKFVGLAAIVSGIASSLAFAAPAKAGLEFCNKGKQGTAFVAIAYPIGKGQWQTEGWLNLKEGECGTLIEGDLDNRYYYYFAETTGNYTWEGDQKFCVSSRKFTFANADTQCKGANSRWENFRELDTGKDATEFTLNLE